MIVSRCLARASPTTSTLAALATTASPCGRLVRDHIADSLSSYFGSRPEVVGALEYPLEFKTMVGRSGYEFRLNEIYRKAGVSWLTPAEIFQPHVGEAIARFVVRNHLRETKKDKDGEQDHLRICEIGGGNGTLAADVMDYVSRNDPRVYETMEYTVLDVSESLCERQRERVARRGGDGHAQRFSSVAADAASREAWRDLGRSWGGGHVYVLGLEVLDNLAHDRVERREGRWMETWVEYEEDGSGGELGRETLRPVRDGLIRRTMEAFDWAGSAGAPGDGSEAGILSSIESFVLGKGGAPADDSGVVFLPTAAQAILENLSREIPSHTLLMMDFDHLPDVRVPGRNAPLVSNTVASVAQDASTYLVPPGSHDIFFPTNFEALAAMYARLAGEGARTTTSACSAFFKEHADLQRTTTMSGYNPLIEDFTNTKVFVGTTRKRTLR